MPDAWIPWERGSRKAGAWKTRGVYSSTKPKPTALQPLHSTNTSLAGLGWGGGTSHPWPQHPSGHPAPEVPHSPSPTLPKLHPPRPPRPGLGLGGGTPGAPGLAGSSLPRGGGSGVGDAAVRGAGPGSPRRSRLDWFRRVGAGLHPSPPGFTAFIAPSRQAEPWGGGAGAEHTWGPSSQPPPPPPALSWVGGQQGEAEPQAPTAPWDPLPSPPLGCPQPNMPEPLAAAGARLGYQNFFWGGATGMMLWHPGEGPESPRGPLGR